MRSFLRLQLVILLATSLFAQSTSTERSLWDFPPQGSERERVLETKFDATLNPDDLRRG